MSVRYGLGIRSTTQRDGSSLEFDTFYFVCCYTPQRPERTKRIDYRMTWEEDLQAYLQALDKEKPVVYAGDLNGRTPRST